MPAMRDIDLSIVVLAWDQLPYTAACVESLRSHTDVPYELVIVDNGSEAEAAQYAEDAADTVVLNPENLGFAPGMNQGLAAAKGTFVAFVNNDTVFPEAWASKVLETLDQPGVGIVAPAVTAAGNPITVRSEPGMATITLDPFGELPSGVVYVLKTELARSLGGWSEDYLVASAEDLDLAFTVWTNDLSIVVDERVLVEHVSRGTVRAKLPNRDAIYRTNLEQFLDKWSGPDKIIRIDDCPREAHTRNRQAGRSAAMWLRRLIAERDVSRSLREAAQSSPAKKRLFRSS